MCFLSFCLQQPSPVFRVEDETPFTSSLQSTDGETAGATAFELPSKDSQEPYVSSSSDDRELDFIPEKESREMIWSPEEIELKRIQRKYPRTLSLEERGESTYDRIEHRDEDIQVEMSDETLETIKIERSDLAPYGADISTENELLDDRVSPETDKQLNEGYFSISNLNHVGFLACQLGQGDTSGDRRHNGTIEEDSEPLDEGTVDGEFSYSETSLIQNLDPFAPDSEKRTALMFANLEQGTSHVGNREPTSGNQSVKQSHPFTSAPSSTQPGHRIGKTSTNAKKHGNSYGYVKSPDSWKSEGINRTKFPGYVKTTSLSSRAGSGTLSSSRGTLAPSSESLPEFSKLDPFASSAEKFEISDNFNPRSNSPGMGNERAMRPLLQRSKPAQTVQNLFFNIKKQPQSSYQKLNSGSNYGSLSGKAGKEEQRPLLSEFSSFLVRDPFSEILTNDQSQSTDSSSSSYGAEELSYREKVAQTATTGISTNKTYGAQNILRNSSTPVSEKLKQLEQVRTSTTPSGVAPSLRKSSKSFPNPCLSRTGYVPVPGRSTSINQTVVATAPDRNTTSQASKFKSQDNVAPNHLPAFSDRDPFSEMLPQKCEVNEGRSSVGTFVKVRGNEAMNKSKVGLQGQLPDHSVQAFRHPLKDRSQATPALKKQNYVRVAGRNGHQRNMASPTHLVDKYECDPTKPSPTCSVDSRIDSISDCDIMSDILQSWDKADGNGKESSDMFPNLTYAELMTSNSKSTSSRVTQSTKTGPRESSHYRSSTSNYASFTNENKLSEKPKSSTQAVPLPQSSIDIVEGFKDMDPFKETRTTQALRADSKSEDQPAVVYSSICTTSPSELRSRNSPVDPVGDGRAEEEEKRTEIKMGVNSSEMLPGVSFGNRDPFAEIIPSKTTLINKSPEECLGEERIHLARTNERSENALEGLAEDVGESISSACTENDTISNFVNTRADLLSGSGYQSVKSNAGEKQPTGVQSSTFDSTSNVTEKRSVSNELRPRLEETTNIVPLSSTDNGGRQQPPDKDKQLTRKVSDIDSAYAKVKIVNAGTTSYQKVVNSSETADESVLGAVGREELVTEVDQERDTGPAPEDKEETVVDPFNIPAAAESIQNLGSNITMLYKIGCVLLVIATILFHKSCVCHSLCQWYLRFVDLFLVPTISESIDKIKPTLPQNTPKQTVLPDALSIEVVYCILERVFDMILRNEELS